jgi:hypothetical protein
LAAIGWRRHSSESADLDSSSHAIESWPVNEPDRLNLDRFADGTLDRKAASVNSRATPSMTTRCLPSAGNGNRKQERHVDCHLRSRSSACEMVPFRRIAAVDIPFRST